MNKREGKSLSDAIAANSLTQRSFHRAYNLVPQHSRLYICCHHSLQHFALEAPLFCFTIQKHVHLLHQILYLHASKLLPFTTFESDALNVQRLSLI